MNCRALLEAHRTCARESYAAPLLPSESDCICHIRSVLSCPALWGVIGHGASGVVYRGSFGAQQAAVKVLLGADTFQDACNEAAMYQVREESSSTKPTGPRFQCFSHTEHV